MYRRAILIVTILIIAIAATAHVEPVSHYTFDELHGSARVYPAPERRVQLPDTLTPVMINHLGRHGARYETSPKRVKSLRASLIDARQKGMLTALGDSMLEIVERAYAMSRDKWGMLDSTGMSEQQGIAERIYEAWPTLVKGARIESISSYVPRCIMSMDEFTHRLAVLDNDVEILSSSGRMNSSLLRPFAIDSAYLNLRRDAPWSKELKEFYKNNVPLEPVWRLIDKRVMDEEKAREFAIPMFGFLCGLNASGMKGDFLEKFYTYDEAYRMWECRNLMQYLERTASVYSAIPSEITCPLLADIINTTDDFLAGRSKASLSLRFGHAETIMPFLSLIKLQDCYYAGKNMNDVGQHWQNFHVTPMASNFQMIVCMSTSGTPYVRIDLNERPILFPGTDCYYVTWEYARRYFDNILNSSPLIPGTSTNQQGVS
ncbi:hypothetical protein [uncultured Muribaculum sp.]|uniref:hypothetical protein n=1 Tax=uncultured Muribaculum sp. TaxID=1918613 RepID=UPI0025D45D0B|nr:hypothetical protein [uncultured Muribaculum sp.]